MFLKNTIKIYIYFVCIITVHKILTFKHYYIIFAYKGITNIGQPLSYVLDNNVCIILFI